MKDRRSLVAWAVAYTVFAAVRVAAIAGRPVGIFDDTYGYLNLSFVGHGRPWVVPLLYNVISADGLRIVAQCAIGIVCWCGLAYVAASVVQRTPLKVIIAAGVLVVGASPQVTRWDLALLSESLALSLTAAAIACWILFAMRATTGRMVAVWAITLLWAFTRPAHLMLLPVLLVLLLVSLSWRSGRRLRGALLCALVPVAIWGAVSVRNDPGMTEFNVDSILDIRMLANADRAHYFAEHGMPLTRSMLRFHGVVRRDSVGPSLVRYARIPTGFKVPVIVAAGGRPFIRWMRDKGPTTYVEWLASHPKYTFVEPLQHLDDLVTADLQSITPAFESRSVLPSFLTSPIYESFGFYLFAFAAALLSAIVAVLRRLFSRPLTIAWCVIASSVAMLYIVWLGSAIEGARHAIVASVASRIGLLLVLTFTADLYLTARRKGLATADDFFAAELVPRSEPLGPPD
jgi:hypothetical protein